MSTFDERLRERVNNLISETMDDVASEIRKAVTPQAKSEPEQGVVLGLTQAQAFRLRCVLATVLGMSGLLESKSRREVESIQAILRAAEGTAAPPAASDADLCASCGNQFPPDQTCTACQRLLRLPGTELGNDVYLRFDDKAFGDWFVRQIRIHGGIGRWLPR